MPKDRPARGDAARSPLAAHGDAIQALTAATFGTGRLRSTRRQVRSLPRAEIVAELLDLSGMSPLSARAAALPFAISPS
jgi:hypothetical protein